jgi:glycosyltransferase involved in cell wall biosynthesis
MPNVSIVIPAHNAERFLAETVRSVVAQTVSDWELVIVDDGSHDGTAPLAQQAAERDARIRLVRQTHSGLSRARNAGVAHSDGGAEALIFLDADDLLESDALAQLSAALAASPRALGVYGLARYIDERGRPIRVGQAEQHGRSRRALVGGRPVSWPPDRPMTFAVAVLGNYISTPGQVLLRRRAFELVGGFDPALVAAEDWDLWLRLTARGDLALLDRVVIGYRRHDRNMSNDGQQVTRSLRKVRRKLLASGDLTEDQRRLARLAGRWSDLQGSPR